MWEVTSGVGTRAYGKRSGVPSLGTPLRMTYGTVCTGAHCPGTSDDILLLRAGELISSYKVRMGTYRMGSTWAMYLPGTFPNRLV